MSNYINKFSFLFCFIICTAYQLFFYRYGLNLWDEGGFAYGSLRVLNGEIPLIDFGYDGYPPGRYLLGALFFKLFGISLSSLRLLIALFTSLMVILIYHASKNIMDRNFAFITSLLLFSAPSMYYNRLFPIFTVINIYFISRYINSKRKYDLALSIFVILLTFLIKVEIGIISLIVLLIIIFFHLFFHDRNISFDFKSLSSQKKISLYIIVAFAITIIAAAINAKIPEKVFKIFFQTYSMWGNPMPSLFQSYENGFPTLKGLFDNSLFYLPLIVYLSAAFLLIKRKFIIQIYSNLDKRNLHILSVLLFGIGTYGLVVWRAGFDNLLRVLPAFYILLCFLLFLFYKKIMRHIAQSETQGIKNYFTNFALLIPVLIYPSLFIVNFNLYHGFYAGSVGEIRKDHIYMSFERSRVFVDPMEAMWIEDVVYYIKRLTEKDDPIFAVPLNPLWYFLSERKNPTSYDWVLPQTTKLLENEQKIIRQLEANPPKVIIYGDIAIDGKEERRFENYAPKLYEYFTNNYRVEQVSGLFYMLRRKAEG